MNRLDQSARDRRLRAALDRRKEIAWTPDPVRPLNWWSKELETQHRQWLEAELPPVQFEALRWVDGPHTPGQPVHLRSTDGHLATAYVRLVGCGFRRWLGAGDGGGICHTELTFRDPRSPDLWGDPYVLQLAMAVLDAHHHPEGGHAWLAGAWEERLPSGELACPALAELLDDALEELEQPPRPHRPLPAQLVKPQPEPRRGWQPHELRAMGMGR